MHPSNAYRADKELPHPSKIPSEHNRLAAPQEASASQSRPARQKRHGSDPKTAAPGRQEFAPRHSLWATSSRLPGSAPKQPARAPSAPGAEPRVAGLRRPPADKLVTSEKEAAPAEGCPSHRQRHSRSR